MSDKIRAALDHLYRATDLGCGCTPPVEISATAHIEEHIGHAIAILEEEALPDLRCDNCGKQFHRRNTAYLIRKGNIAQLAKASDSGDASHRLLLCPRCYDNNWIIGRADDV